jgi:hypothetical protein
MKGGAQMTIQNIPVSATLRVTDMQDDIIQSISRVEPNMQLGQAELLLDAIGVIRGTLVGNGLLIVTNELRQAA